MHFVQLRFVLFAFGDVFDGALVVEQRARCIAHGSCVLGNPDHASVFSIHLRLQSQHLARLVDPTLELGSAQRIHIQPGTDVRKGRLQLAGRIVAIHAGERRVGHEVTPFRGRLEDAFD